jgi:hypothetical protein
MFLPHDAIIVTWQKQQVTKRNNGNDEHGNDENVFTGRMYNICKHTNKKC